MATDHSIPPAGQSKLGTLKMGLPLIGLTGGIGSGKTAVSDLLAQLVLESLIPISSHIK